MCEKQFKKKYDIHSNVSLMSLHFVKIILRFDVEFFIIRTSKNFGIFFLFFIENLNI